MSYARLRDEDSVELQEKVQSAAAYGQVPVMPTAPLAPTTVPARYDEPTLMVMPGAPVVAHPVQPQQPAASVLHDFEVGTPGEFFCFFMISMLFGLLGFLVSLCVAATHAARLGARAGFSSALLMSGVFMMTSNFAMETDAQTTVLAIGVLFFAVGMAGLSAATRAWRRVRRAALLNAVARSGYAVSV